MNTEELRRIGRRAKPAPTFGQRIMDRVPAIACACVLAFVAAIALQGIFR